MTPSERRRINALVDADVVLLRNELARLEAICCRLARWSRLSAVPEDLRAVVADAEAVAVDFEVRQKHESPTG